MGSTDIRPRTKTPQKRDRAATSEALLNAAIAEFAEHGFAGGRVDRIADSAGVNKQLVYHYFGNKDELYQAALEKIYTDIRSKEGELHLADLPPRAAMETLVGFSFDYLAEHPEFIALIGDENRLDARHLKQFTGIVELHSPLIQLIEQTMKRGAEEGIFDDRFGSVDLYLSIAGLCFFFFANQNTLSVIFNQKMTSGAQVARRRQHVVDFVISAISVK
ncbi:TetR/AcrR family transcriptional regulator [Mesorhizobium sp. Z1-4]|uniref:TetR/AcrR family transcriptional regulator n=1 Tax=Mesorhizobium sp. Z1-4 TaxID=2448478 RepID=UPI000FDBC58B|nr:TetR/AcrR family transcriptional regulator [Mesorhizobium sp. Z1-4]